MNIHLNTTLEGSGLTVAQLAIAHPRALAIFTKYNIDYCCGGHRSLKEAWDRIGLNSEKVLAEINQPRSMVVIFYDLKLSHDPLNKS